MAIMRGELGCDSLRPPIQRCGTLATADHEQKVTFRRESKCVSGHVTLDDTHLSSERETAWPDTRPRKTSGAWSMDGGREWCEHTDSLARTEIGFVQMDGDTREPAGESGTDRHEATKASDGIGAESGDNPASIKEGEHHRGREE